MKILGSYISHDLTNDREVSQIIPILDNRINQFERLKSYTNFETRLQFSNAYIIGRLVYMMPMYTNFTNQQKDTLHRVLMRTPRNRIPTSQECLQKNSERYLIQNWRYPYIYHISQGCKPTDRVTDIQVFRIIWF